MLTDAPGALGMSAMWERLSSRGLIAQTESGLSRAADAGLIAPPAGVTAH